MIGFPSVEYTIELSEALAEFEDVMLMIPESHATRFKDVIKGAVNIYPFCYPRLRYPTNLIMINNLLKKIREYKPDIIHLQRGHPWFNFALPLLKKNCLIITIHDVIALDWPTKRLPAFTFKPPIIYGNQFIVHGKKLKKLMVKVNKKSPDDIHVLRRGVNSIYTRYIDNPIKDNGRTILYFGRIWGYKGLAYLIKAEPLITRKIPDAKIIIAGAAKDFNQYEKMMVNRENFIVHNEYIPNNMVAKLFQEASLVALPYINGSQSGVIPMAYAFKKPVVITDVGSLSENVDNGVTGYIVPPKNPEKLAEAIIDLMINEEKRKKMGENAFKKTQEELSWENIAVKTIKVYKKALSTKNSS
jgi:glycosyltransferase involved in cell wall biosynthesis